jgi:hypothetical protein
MNISVIVLGKLIKFVVGTAIVLCRLSDLHENRGKLIINNLFAFLDSIKLLMLGLVFIKLRVLFFLL